MALESIGQLAVSPSAVAEQDLPRRIELKHSWRATPAGVVAFHIRIAPAAAEWFRIQGQDGAGWVTRPSRRIGAGNYGTAITHRVVLEARRRLGADRLARLEVRAVGPANTVTRGRSVIVEAS